MKHSYIHTYIHNTAREREREREIIRSQTGAWCTCKYMVHFQSFTTYTYTGTRKHCTHTCTELHKQVRTRTQMRAPT